MEDYLSKVLETVAFINERINERPEIAIILGSGLGGLADEVNERIEIPYSEIPNFPCSHVEGHKNQLVIGKIYGKNVIIMQGRFHYCEGYDMSEIAFPIKVFSFLGVSQLIASNAAGGINPSFKAGDLILLKDHINLSGLSPLRGEHNAALGERFPNMKNAYSTRLINIAKEQMANIRKEKEAENKAKAKEKSIGRTKKTDKKSEEVLIDDLGEFADISFEAADLELKEGVYAFMPGPQYETDAEIKMLSLLGADCVGMSTVPEVISAVQSGIEVLGISCIANECHSNVPPTHQEVLTTADRISDGFKTLVMHIIMAM